MRTEFNEYNNYRKPLTHTYKKLTEDKELTVVYFGGSVTAGYGSSDPAKYSWRALIGKWLDEQFPEADIEHINRAVGESGTYLGTHRVQMDVIGPEPDLIFLEYSINDKYYGSTYEKAASQYETIVREVKKALPKTDIVTILVTDSGCFLTNKMGKLHTQAQAHEDIAQQYNIPTLHVGRLLSKVANYSNEEWKPKYAIDIVHLTDEGNKVYYDCIEEFMYNSLFCTDYSNLSDEPEALIPVVSETLFDGNRQHIQPKKDVLTASEEMGGCGISSNLSAYSGSSYARGTFTLDSTDDLLVFKFNGTEIALWCNYYKEDRFLISIDDGDYNKKTGSSHAPAILAEDLEPGEHIIRIKIVDPEKPLKIGSIFTRDESLATKKGEN